MLPIKDPHRLHKDDYEKFLRIINGTVIEILMYFPIESKY